ncbi:MAG: GntR family transcriptional regulator [Chitinivibrionales bacterium]|nr:GntR family transcriptional regulator [Chitinivibrionales bacterium]
MMEAKHMTAPGPAVHRAQAHLRQLLSSLQNGEHLPPLRSLARDAGVSYATMQAAVKALHEQRALTVRHGSGIVAGGCSNRQPPSAPREQLPPLPRWQSTARALREAILTGHYPQGSVLPSQKQLRLSLGVGQKTLARALRRLWHEGIVYPHGRTFGVTRLSAGPGAGTVVLILRGGPDGEVVFPSARSRENLRSLEIACAQAAVRLALVTSRPGEPSLCYPAGHDGVLEGRMGAVIGYLVWSTALSPRWLEGLAAMLRRSGKPIVLFDEGGPSGLAGMLGQRCRRYMAACGETAGRQMANYLLSIGHRRLLYLSYDPEVIWSTLRFAGMRDAVQGVRDARLLRCSARGERTGPIDDSAPRKLREFLRDLHDRRDRKRFALVLRTLDRHAEDLRVFHTRACRREQFTPLLQSALELSRREQVTAWIAENDELALAALEHVRGAGLTVPRQLSIAGFDDSEEAHVTGLTSYNFNGSAYVHAMLSAVLGYAPRATAAGSPVTIEGIVIPRMSTAPHGG